VKKDIKSNQLSTYHPGTGYHSTTSIIKNIKQNKKQDPIKKKKEKEKEKKRKEKKRKDGFNEEAEDYNHFKE
jgi:acyl-CoA hydrolase